MILLLSGCDRAPESPPESSTSNQVTSSTILKVSVFRDGKVEIDGNELTIDEATQQIVAASGSETPVYYYREAGEEEPHPNASKIIASVVEAKLPISLSSEPDFSTYVDENGQIQKRID